MIVCAVCLQLQFFLSALEELCGVALLPPCGEYSLLQVLKCEWVE